MNPQSNLYATDEDVAVRAPADFALVCPPDQVVVTGTDGVFDTSDPWTMTSLSVNFASRGVGPGHVVQLLGPVPPLRPDGERYAVAAVGPGAVKLRRIGQPLAVGQPPGAGGVLSGVEFLVATLGPQLGSASYEIDHRFGVGPATPGRGSSDLFDPAELREATVLTTLYRRYLDLGLAGDSGPKAAAFRAELDELLGRLVVHWGADGSGPSSTRFGTRISR